MPDPNRKTLPKVTAFITRARGPKAQLLYFRHPLAGVQLPAGTVEWGESPEEAVRREAREESGLPHLHLVTRLAVLHRELPPGERGILRYTKVFDEPAYDASSRGHSLRRGLTVKVTGTAGKFAAVTFEDGEIHFSGYVRRSLLAGRIERHCYHLEATEDAADTWAVETDSHTFQLFWAPLVERQELDPIQAAWLEAVYDSLVTNVALEQ